jgi:hypothetical protein
VHAAVPSRGAIRRVTSFILHASMPTAPRIRREFNDEARGMVRAYERVTQKPVLVLGVDASGGATMDLAIWYPALFLLGLVGMGLCLAFLDACEKI